MNDFVPARKSPDGNYIATVIDEQLRVKSAGDGHVVWTYPQDHFHTIWGIAWSPNSSKIAVSDAGVVRVLDARDGHQSYVFKGITEDAFAPDWSSNGKYLAAIGTTAGTKESPPHRAVVAWDAETQTILLDLPEDPGSKVRWSPDSRRIAFNSDKETVEIWDTVTKSKLASIPLSSGGRPPFDWSPDGKYLVIADWSGGQAIVHDAATGKPITSQEFKGSIAQLNWSHDGKTISCTPDYGASQVWQLDYEANGQLRVKTFHQKTPGDPGYMPTTLEECFTQLNAQLEPSLIQKIKEGTEAEVDRYHRTLGMWIRNGWGLWGHSPLHRSLAAMGAHHPEDMSSIILHAYWRRLHNLPLDVDKQIAQCNAYWAEQRAAAEAEKVRTANAAEKIRKIMMGLKLTGAPEATLEIPSLIGEQLRVRYAALYENGALFTTKKYVHPNSFRTEAFLFDSEHSSIHPVNIRELDTIDILVVLKEQLYVSGSAGSSQRIIQINKNKRKQLPIPEGDGWLRFGTSQDGLLAVRAHAIYLWRDEKWQKICGTSDELPCTCMPPQLIDGRVYFRDEGVNESYKRLSWVDISGAAPPKLIYFDKDIGLIGFNGPRWENVSSFAETPDKKLWICAGESSQSLIVWAKDSGYKIATINDELTLTGDDLLGHDRSDSFESGDVAITCVAPDSDGPPLAFGPTGMYSIKNPDLKPILLFTKGIQDTPKVIGLSWIPTHVLRIGPDDYFIGTHWGGTMRLRRDAQGHFAFQLLDAKVGKSIQI